MFHQKTKNSYLFFLMLNAFLLMTLPFFTQKIFAQNNEQPNQTQNTTNKQSNQTPNTHNVNVQDDVPYVVETVNNSFNDKMNIGMAKVVDELKTYAMAQHSDKTSKKMIQNVVNDMLSNYLNIDEWAEVETDFFTVFPYDGDWMKSIVVSMLTNVGNNTVAMMKKAYKTSYTFVFDAFTKDMDDAVADTISTLWPSFAK
ncbi:hypothetical protein [Candidatus Phytoplasma pruni]|uniref:Immunodominant membrane protein n=1 Tax=Candidatus Phytoplasma pruni TaxID=479893 RepID=A0A851HI37_9MOLU|nr:hypothetical protein [Candidatus Phytoplasma pruni]NWN45473.1 hypothetical protein [Candidatus Phytoplasma pruni]